MKPLCQGVAAASLAGLLLGGVLKPELKVADGPGGPQMLAGISGTRAYPDAQGDVDLTGWSGPVPDYVVGTDSLRRPAYPDDPAYEPYDDLTTEWLYTEWLYEEPPADPVSAPEPLAWEAAADEPAPLSAPSQSGDILAGIGAPPPPEPPFTPMAPGA